MAKHFLGEDGACEIWVRAQQSVQYSEKRCPACSKPMRIVNEPQWLGGFEVDVCCTCYLIWFEADENIEIPHPEDMLTPEGDSTRIKDAGMALADYITWLEKRKNQKNAMVCEGPASLQKKVIGFLSLPVMDDENEDVPQKWWATGIMAVLMILLNLFVTSNNVILEYGFYPSDPFKNFGLNILSSGVLHAGWFHLISNLYFFLLISADIEGYLGSIRYLILWLSLAVVGNFFLCIASGSPDLPHIGASGIVMGLMATYVFIYPHRRLTYLIPSAHFLTFPGGGFTRLWGYSWIRVPIWVVLIMYIFLNFVGYWLYESSGISSTSFSGHLGGILAGSIFSLIFILPNKTKLPMRNSF